MIEQGRFLCDRCKQQIVISSKSQVRVLLEFEKGANDRHYCENCFPEVLKATDPPPKRARQDRRIA